MQTLETLGKEHNIPVLPDDYETEFEVQASLYAALKTHGFKVRGEVKWVNKKTRETCRFDLVIYENARPTRIVEVKAAHIKHRNGLEVTRQARRYRNFGVPVTFVYGAGDAATFLQTLIRERGEA
jgi:type I site-specific restriction-modification system R (restriction) subunit